ncbi:MAG: ribose-phosphate diphosphokinase [Candidatus Bathyarchaeota archaeon]|jgi:ribose-phosphate pyrophosphokinase|nr:ribose-phosphate diphosphokinase [Candidatus Bathyarchaeota archaeon A05DMB-3]MDH7606743.1 ribose-phosphate diphosphokinase [Candidatus Bathyarchaeota archaeon]
MKILPGPASKELGEKIAELLGVEAVPVFFKVFPDGESYVRIEGAVEGEKAVIVQTTSPPQDIRIVQLALIADAAKRKNARKVVAVVPYLAYARQDKAFLQGEAVSIEAIARMLKAAGVDSLITVNVHEKKVLEKFPFPAKSLSAIPLLAEYFRQKGFEEAFALAPDKGAINIAEEAAKVLGGECGYLEKRRDRYTGHVTVEKKEFNVKDKTVIIFDDIISTGGTIVAAAKILHELGAAKIYAACVHPLLVGEAEKRIREAEVAEIVGTDSIPSQVSKVSLAPLIAKALKELKSG